MYSQDIVKKMEEILSNLKEYNQQRIKTASKKNESVQSPAEILGALKDETNRKKILELIEGMLKEAYMLNPSSNVCPRCNRPY